MVRAEISPNQYWWSLLAELWQNFEQVIVPAGRACLDATDSMAANVSMDSTAVLSAEVMVCFCN